MLYPEAAWLPRFDAIQVNFDASSAVSLHSPLSSLHDVINCHAFYRNVHHRGFCPKQLPAVWSLPLENGDWNLLLSSIYLAGRRADEKAVQVYRRTFQTAPEWIDLRLISAREHLGRRRFGEAFEDVRVVLERAPERSEAWALLGEAAQ